MTNQHPIADCVFMSPLQDDGACVDDLTSLWARSSRFGFGLELILYAVVFYFWCVCVCACAYIFGPISDSHVRTARQPLSQETCKVRLNFAAYLSEGFRNREAIKAIKDGSQAFATGLKSTAPIRRTPLKVLNHLKSVNQALNRST